MRIHETAEKGSKSGHVVSAEFNIISHLHLDKGFFLFLIKHYTRLGHLMHAPIFDTAPKYAKKK